MVIVEGFIDIVINVASYNASCNSELFELRCPRSKIVSRAHYNTLFVTSSIHTGPLGKCDNNGDILCGISIK